MKQDPATFDLRFEQAHAAFAKKIRTFARNSAYAVEGFDIEDMEQEFLLVLANTVRDYDPDRGASFNTLFQGNAKRRISDLIRRMNTKSRKTVYVYLDDDEVLLAIQDHLGTASAEDEVIAKETVRSRGAEAVRAALTLTPAEAKRLSA